MIERRLYAVYEMRDASGLPVEVLASMSPIRCDDGENVRVLMSRLSRLEARRLAAERIRQVHAWAGGSCPWMRQKVALRPGVKGSTIRRPVLRIAPDGHVER